MEVEYSEKFYKDVQKIGRKSVKNSIFQVIHQLKSSNSISEITNTRKMEGFKNAYRIRVGTYRIGLFYEKGIILLGRVAHRKDIYKLFP